MKSEEKPKWLQAGESLARENTVAGTLLALEREPQAPDELLAWTGSGRWEKPNGNEPTSEPKQRNCRSLPRDDEPKRKQQGST
jgi:hypothetical protein